MDPTSHAQTVTLPTGTRDGQTVRSGGARAADPQIKDVRIIELGNVLTRSGCVTEIFRKDWGAIGITPQHVVWVNLNPNGITDWHRHTMQTDHLVGVNGVIKLALWDGRPSSPTAGRTEVIRFGGMRPVLVIVPPGVWHALRNESGAPAGYLNITDQLYNYENPDNWRLPADTPGLPPIL